MSRPSGQQTDNQPLEGWEYMLLMPAFKEDHWRLFYEILWETGARVGEALAILKTDITTDKGSEGVWIVSEKRKDHLRVHIPLTPELYQRLKAYIFYLHGIKVFPYTSSAAWLALKVACAASGVRTTIHPHSFRHGFGHRAMNTDLGAKTALDHLKAVQEMMRHSSINSTQVYTHLTKDEVKQGFRKMNKKGGNL